MRDVLIHAVWKTTMLAIDWVSIRAFVLGLLTGFALLSLAIAMLMISGEKNRKKRTNRRNECADCPAPVAELIVQKQKELGEIVRIAENSYFRVAFDLSFDLIQEIAKHYFPHSRYPLYELTPQEVMDLVNYISKRVDKLMSGKLIRKFRNYRISLIVDIMQKKKAFDNSKLMKANRELKLSKILSIGSAVLNAANPIYWFRKLALKPSTTLVTKELCKLIIKIAGEETDKIYSKKLFQPPVDPEKVEKELEETIEEAVKSPIAEEDLPPTK
ncbi:MAG TPA: hypothetical protein P5154_04770 [Candidatus Izemoplasmatales bacterium]|nr:hypothetical protein [Candidatus Izemoplasmatales bacterium]